MIFLLGSFGRFEYILSWTRLCICMCSTHTRIFLFVLVLLLLLVGYCRYSKRKSLFTLLILMFLLATFISLFSHFVFAREINDKSVLCDKKKCPKDKHAENLKWWSASQSRHFRVFKRLANTHNSIDGRTSLRCTSKRKRERKESLLDWDEMVYLKT